MYVLYELCVQQKSPSSLGIIYGKTQHQEIPANRKVCNRENFIKKFLALSSSICRLIVSTICQQCEILGQGISWLVWYFLLSFRCELKTPQKCEIFINEYVYKCIDGCTRTFHWDCVYICVCVTKSELTWMKLIEILFGWAFEMFRSRYIYVYITRYLVCVIVCQQFGCFTNAKIELIMKFYNRIRAGLFESECINACGMVVIFSI